MGAMGNPAPLVDPLSGGVLRSSFHYCFLGGAASIIIMAVLLGVTRKSNGGSQSVALGIRIYSII